MDDIRFQELRNLETLRFNLMNNKNNLPLKVHNNVRNVMFLNAETVLSVMNNEKLLTGIYVGGKKYPNGSPLADYWTKD